MVHTHKPGDIYCAQCDLEQSEAGDSALRAAFLPSSQVGSCNYCHAHGEVLVVSNVSGGGLEVRFCRRCLNDVMQAVETPQRKTKMQAYEKRCVKFVENLSKIDPYDTRDQGYGDTVEAAVAIVRSKSR